MVSVQDTLSQINSVLKASAEGPYKHYSCKTVSWDDVQRGTVGGQLSCWGANITDTRLYAKDGRQLFTVRGDNWNERLGKVTSKDIALIATNEAGGGGSTGLRPVTLRSVLSNISDFGGYAKLDTASLADDALDDEVSVRFQTTFLPVEAGEKTALEFAPEAYNYNTRDDEDPRNIILLCTTQGLAVQQDGKGAKKLFHHAKRNGQIKRYWLEAETSSHKVGGAQQESAQEKEDALVRGKATSAVIGTKAIGTRFNVLMTIQVPLQQHPKRRPTSYPSTGGFGGFFEGCAPPKETSYFSRESRCAGLTGLKGCVPSGKANGFVSRKSARSVVKAKRAVGKSSAARVSRGSEFDSWNGLTVKKPKRHSNEHITCTIVMYYTCSIGVPSADDVKAAIDDLEKLYQSVETNGKLADQSFDFMKSELTVKDAIDVKTKIVTQPPPKPSLPINSDVFPN